MRIVVDRDLFEVESPAEAMLLVDFLSTVLRDSYPHAVITDPPYAVGGDNGPIDGWLASRSTLEAHAFRDGLSSGLIRAAGTLSAGASDTIAPRRWHVEGSLTIRVGRRPSSDWQRRELTLADAIDLLREPAHLVLENARTELAFVRHLAGATDGVTLQSLVDRPGRIQVHGGGGGEGKQWLRWLAEGQPDAVLWRRLLRTWVLFDKDAGDPDARDPSSLACDLVALCERVTSARGNGLSWVCLQRREIESYVPDRGLLAEKTDRQEPFVRLVIAWRADRDRAPWAWALDLKKGLHGDRHARWDSGLSDAEKSAVRQRRKPLEPHMLKAPFSGLSAAEIRSLASGLGDDLGEALRGPTDPTWAHDIPAEYDRGPDHQAPRLAVVQSLFDRM